MSGLLLRRRGVIGTAPAIDPNLYNEGANEEAWVAGLSSGTGSQSKEVDHLLLTAESSAAERTWVTDETVDLTGIAQIEIDWSAPQFTNGSFNLIASTNKDSGSGTFDARLQKTASFSRTVDTLDVSSLSGMHHVRLHAVRGGGGTATNELRTFRVTLKE